MEIKETKFEKKTIITNHKENKKTSDTGSNKCSKCKGIFSRIDLWKNPENPREFTCRECMTKNRIAKQKPFESDFRNFKNRQDYVPQEENFQTSQFRISDEEFDKIIQEFEQAHWSEISSSESQKHKQYIESLFKREFFHRRQNKYKKTYQKTQQTFEEESDLAIHYNVLEVSQKSSDKEIKEAYRRLVLKWHPDKNPNEPKYAEKMLILVKIAFEKIMKSRN